MAEFGKIDWEASGAVAESSAILYGDPFAFFLDYCKPQLPETDLSEACRCFLHQIEQLRETFKISIGRMAEQPFLAAFLLWIKETSPNNTDACKLLLDKQFIGLRDKTGATWTIQHARTFNHAEVMEAIRSHPALPLLKKEELVAVYLDFLNWISKQTFGYIPQTEDPDLARVQSRFFPFPHFIRLINQLEGKDRLVAKLLYYGGTHTLEEILNLKTQDIDVERRCVHFPYQDTFYPLHVFADMHALAKGAEGPLFVGRQKAPLNPATIFRNFKEAAISAGLEENFTPKILTLNK